MAEQSRHGGALRLGRHDRRKLDLAGAVSQCREGGRWIGERIDHHSRSLGFDLDPRPAQPTHLHLLPPFYRTIVRYHLPHAPPFRRRRRRDPGRRHRGGDPARLRGGARWPHHRRPRRSGGDEKSSVYSLFGSKEDLQRATFDAAVESFRCEVWDPVADREPGLPRLLALCESWLDYHRREVMPGGCFLTTATVEFDARPGPLRDATAETMERWLGLLEREARIAIDAGDLPPDTDAADLAFELNALAAAGSSAFSSGGIRSSSIGPSVPCAAHWERI